MKKISVVIPTCYGDVSMLKTVDSILNAKKNLNHIDIEIIIVADTVPINGYLLKSLNKRKVHVLQNKVPSGQFKKVKQGIKIATGDLIIFTQDDVIFNINSIEEICKYMSRYPQVDMATVNDKPINRFTSFSEPILNIGYLVSNRIRMRWNKGQNYLRSCGRCIIFRKNFVRKLEIPDNLVSGDAYLYFESKRNKGIIGFIENAYVYFKLPSSIKEQRSKSSRHLYTSDEMTIYFDNVAKEFKVPIFVKIESALFVFFQKPIEFILYLIILGYTRLYRLPKRKALKAIWDVELSTKKI